MKACCLVTIRDGVVHNLELFCCSGNNSIISKGQYAGEDLVDTVEALFSQLLSEAGVPEQDIAVHLEDGYYEGPVYTYCITWPTEIHGE